MCCCCCCCIPHFSGLRVGPSFVFLTALRLRRTVCQCVLSDCFRTPRLSLGHPGSLTSMHDLKCMRTQTAPLFNVPRGRRGTTTRVVHQYPCGTSQAGNLTRVVAWGVQSVNHYTTGYTDHSGSGLFRITVSRAQHMETEPFDLLHLSYQVLCSMV